MIETRGHVDAAALSSIEDGGDPHTPASAIETLVAAQKTLEDVVRWGLARRPPCMIELVVVQDEYTHDVVLRWADGVYLVYDTT